MHGSLCRSFAAIVIAITTSLAVPLRGQDTTGRKDTVPLPPHVLPAPTPPPPVPAPLTPAAPTLEQLRYVAGLKTATRGVAQLRDGLSRVARTQAADSVHRRGAARRLGGLCASARTFIAAGRPKMQPDAFADSMRVVAKQLVTRLDSLARALPACEQTAGRQATVVATDLTKRLQAYDDALLVYRNTLAAQNRADSIKTVSQQ